MRRFLFVMGMVFTTALAVGLGSLGYVGFLASTSAETNTAYATGLVREVSQTWSAEHSQDVFTPTALAQATTASGRNALAVMSRLGELRATTDVRQTGYKIDLKTGTTATVSFDGRFDHGVSHVIVVLRISGDRARIVELDLKNIRLYPKPQRRAAV